MKHLNFCKSVLIFLIFIQKVFSYMPQNDEVRMGDSILSKNQYEYFFTNKAFSRYAVSKPEDRWPGGKIPIMVDPSVGFSPKVKQMCQDATNKIMAVSCVKFEWHDSPPGGNYVKVTQGGQGCYTNVGFKNKGMQTINIEEKDPCAYTGGIVHELLHVLGFFHMHSAPNRDQYLEILHENILPDAKTDFEIFKQPGDWYGTEFDYDSIMLYHASAASINPSDPSKVTYKLKKPHNPPPGTLHKLSQGDITRINNMYCKGAGPASKLKAEQEKDAGNSDKSDLEVDLSPDDEFSRSKQGKLPNGPTININIDAHR